MTKEISMEVIEPLVVYVLCVYWLYFLANYAAITHRPASWLKRVLGPTWGYPLSCSLCFAQWVTLALWLVGALPLYYVFAAPILHLFLDAAYDRLCTPPVIR